MINVPSPPREAYCIRFTSGDVHDPHFWVTNAEDVRCPGYWESIYETPMNTQVGGNHYKDMAIQPLEFILANNISFCEGNVIKYVSRWKEKGGVEDLRKAKHYIEVLISANTKNDE